MNLTFLPRKISIPGNRSDFLSCGLRASDLTVTSSKLKHVGESVIWSSKLNSGDYRAESCEWVLPYCKSVQESAGAGHLPFPGHFQCSTVVCTERSFESARQLMAACTSRLGPSTYGELPYVWPTTLRQSPSSRTAWVWK